MSDKHITLMVVSRLGQPVRRYSLPRAVVHAGGTALALLLVAALVGGSVSLSRWVRAEDLRSLQQENRVLLSEIAP